MRAVDTNVLVRLITRDDPRQAYAAEAFVASGAWVSHLAIAEATWVLSAVYELKPAQIATAVGMLLNHQSLSVQDPDAVSGALDRFREHPSIGFSDCLMLQVAAKAGHLPLGTFDRALAKLDGAMRI
jgi:predicted nucleic-acid-binding protein